MLPAIAYLSYKLLAAGIKAHQNNVKRFSESQEKKSHNSQNYKKGSPRFWSQGTTWYQGDGPNSWYQEDYKT